MSHIRCIGDIYDEKFGAEIPPPSYRTPEFEPTCHNIARHKKENGILAYGHKGYGQLCGRLPVETAVVGMPAGFGSPIFDNLESKIASILFAIPAVKAVGFGLGHMFSARFGKRCKHPFVAGPTER